VRSFSKSLSADSCSAGAYPLDSARSATLDSARSNEVGRVIMDEGEGQQEEEEQDVLLPWVPSPV